MEKQKERFMELLKDVKVHPFDQMNIERNLERIFDVLIEKGAILLPCKVGDVVYYVSDSPINLSVQANTIYEADVTRIVTTAYGTTLVIQIHNSYGVTEIPDVNDWGVTVFATREEAEQALRKDEGK